VKVPPAAALGMMEYGEPATAAVAAPPLPLTARVTEPMVSPFYKPAAVNSVLPLPKVTVCP